MENANDVCGSSYFTFPQLLFLGQGSIRYWIILVFDPHFTGNHIDHYPFHLNKKIIFRVIVTPLSCIIRIGSWKNIYKLKYYLLWWGQGLWHHWAVEPVDEPVCEKKSKLEKLLLFIRMPFLSEFVYAILLSLTHRVVRQAWNRLSILEASMSSKCLQGKEIYNVNLPQYCSRPQKEVAFPYQTPSYCPGHEPRGYSRKPVCFSSGPEGRRGKKHPRSWLWPCTPSLRPQEDFSTYLVIKSTLPVLSLVWWNPLGSLWWPLVSGKGFAMISFHYFSPLAFSVFARLSVLKEHTYIYANGPWNKLVKGREAAKSPK